MVISHGVNFNDPLQLREIFKVQEKPDTEPVEYSGFTAVCWEDIRAIDQYFYPDKWKTYPGEKYYISLNNSPTPKLILGSYDSIITHWTQLRNEFPIFIAREDEDL